MSRVIESDGIAKSLKMIETMKDGIRAVRSANALAHPSLACTCTRVVHYLLYCQLSILSVLELPRCILLYSGVHNTVGTYVPTNTVLYLLVRLENIRSIFSVQILLTPTPTLRSLERERATGSPETLHTKTLSDLILNHAQNEHEEQQKDCAIVGDDEKAIDEEVSHERAGSRYEI